MLVKGYDISNFGSAFYVLHFFSASPFYFIYHSKIVVILMTYKTVNLPSLMNPMYYR